MHARKLLHVIFIVLVILAKRQCEKRLKKWTVVAFVHSTLYLCLKYNITLNNRYLCHSNNTSRKKT